MQEIYPNQKILKEEYFFTPETYNQHIQEVINDALNTAAESKCTYIKIDLDGRRTHPTGLCKESIINTFEEIFNKFSV